MDSNINQISGQHFRLYNKWMKTLLLLNPKKQRRRRRKTVSHSPTRWRNWKKKFFDTKVVFTIKTSTHEAYGFEMQKFRGIETILIKEISLQTHNESSSIVYHWSGVLMLSFWPVFPMLMGSFDPFFLRHILAHCCLNKLTSKLCHSNQIFCIVYKGYDDDDVRMRGQWRCLMI